uniref:Uncharacterized protein n=1 Tax=Oryza glumipatula TaxID=40148 RepID=A0A0D9YRC0_9ORYZ
MEELKELTLEFDRKGYLDKHESFFLEYQEPCSLKGNVGPTDQPRAPAHDTPARSTRETRRLPASERR